MFRKIIYGITFLHLSLITMVIFHGLDNDRVFGILERPLAFITAVNYSAWRFAFFTPDVGKSTEVEIILRGDSNRVKRYSTLEGFEFFTSNLESANRFYGYKVHSARDSAFIDLSARSACTFLLNEHQGMDRISFTMRGIIYPKMDGFRKDSLINQAEFYRIEFEL
jgi:hypothetical protein